MTGLMGDKRDLFGFDSQPAVTTDNRDVFDSERQQINMRRKAVGLSPSVDADLVGLALSGGGVRSGAISLGLLQSLDRRGVLRHVDYLSTVSGGGYACAYLSSAALNDRVRRDSPPVPDSNGRPESTDAPARQRLLPITPDGKGPEPARMMDFIHGGQYLRRTWAFINRYAIGLLQIWAVVLSALLALAAIVVWVFKELDNPRVRDFFAALDFESDLAAAFFPSFVLLVLWAAAWGISYFRRQGKANGRVAQVLFYLLIGVTAVAVASLFGTGDISWSAAAPAEGASGNRINDLARMAQTFVFGAILAALLPYLSPKRLFRSGMSPESKPLERYLFVIATRALLYGLPFLLVSYFARENISGWNELRDDSVTLYEISDWNRVSPRAVGATPDEGEGFVARWWNTDQVSAPERRRNVVNVFDDLEQIELQLNVLDSPMDAQGRERLARERVLGNEELSRWRRWRYFGELVVPMLVGSREDVKKNVLFQIWDKRGEIRDTRFAVLDLLSKNMLNRDFYTWFSPDERARNARFGILARLMGTKLASYVYRWVDPWSKQDSPRRVDRWKELRDSFVGNAEKQKWVDRVQSAYDNAARVERENAHEPEPPPNWRKREDLTDQQVLGYENLERVRLAAHRKLLEAYYDGAVTNKSTVYSIVVRTHDQRTRLTWFAWSLGIFLVAATLVSLNATSWHGFYATRIANMWIEPVRGVGATFRWRNSIRLAPDIPTT